MQGGYLSLTLHGMRQGCRQTHDLALPHHACLLHHGCYALGVCEGRGAIAGRRSCLHHSSNPGREICYTPPRSGMDWAAIRQAQRLARVSRWSACGAGRTPRPCACSNHIRRGSMAPEALRGRVRSSSARSTLRHLRTVAGLASQSTINAVTSPAPPQGVGRSSTRSRRLPGLPIVDILALVVTWVSGGEDQLLSAHLGCIGGVSPADCMTMAGPVARRVLAPCSCGCEELDSFRRPFLVNCFHRMRRTAS